MPASNIVRGSIFAAGLAVGVGAASLLNKNNASTSPVSSSPPPRAQVVADEKSTGLVAQGGKPGFTPSRDMAGSLALAPPSSPSSQLASDVFRYGFPGKFPYPEEGREAVPDRTDILMLFFATIRTDPRHPEADRLCSSLRPTPTTPFMGKYPSDSLAFFDPFYIIQLQ
jgi:hypothetical protein